MAGKCTRADFLVVDNKIVDRVAASEVKILDALGTTRKKLYDYNTFISMLVDSGAAAETQNGKSRVEDETYGN